MRFQQSLLHASKNTLKYKISSRQVDFAHMSHSKLEKMGRYSIGLNCSTMRLASRVVVLAIRGMA